MEMHDLVFVLLFLSFIATSSGSFQACRHNITKTENIWNCSDTFIMDFPKRETIPAGTQTYDLSHNRLLELHVINSTCTSVSSCDGCLRNLYLHHNSIDSIDNNAFIHLHCLHTLDLSYNKVKGTSLTSMTFDGLLQLEFLSLKGNPLGKLGDFTLRFNELRLLKKLDLSDCKLKDIELHAFDDLQLLEKIDLGGNELHGVDPNSFHGLHFLEVLDLSRNVMRSIEKGTFLPLIKLHTLFLDGNYIETLPDETFDGVENLEVLSMSDNWLKGIPYGALKRLQSLKVLNISRNHFLHLKASHWPKDVSLRVKELYINEMYGLKSIKNKAFTSFPLLRKVYLSGNRHLETIDHDAFKGSTVHIQEVYLNDCNLKYIPKSLLPWAALQVLNLTGNSWNCDCKLRWMLRDDQFTNRQIRCNQPERLRDRKILELSSHDLHCSRPEVWIALVCVLSVIVIFVLLVIVVEWRFRERLPWHRRKHKSNLSVISRDDYDLMKLNKNDI